MECHTIPLKVSWIMQFQNRLHGYRIILPQKNARTPQFSIKFSTASSAGEFPRLSRRARRARAWSKVCERGMTGTSAERTQGMMGRKRVKQLLVSVVSFPSHNGDNTMATTIIASQIITLCVYLELDWKTLFFNQEILKINRGDLNCEWNIKHEIITVFGSRRS